MNIRSLALAALLAGTPMVFSCAGGGNTPPSDTGSGGASVSGSGGTTGTSSKAGAPGTAGQSSASGATGAAGSAAPTGHAGSTGTTTGTAGASGNAVTTGSAGTTSSPTTGPAGSTATTGPTGSAATTGAAGSAGTTDTTGTVGTTGTAGAATTGATGTATTTTAGSAGTASTASTTGAPGSVTTTGAAGSATTTGAAGSASTTGTVGSVGTTGTGASTGAAGTTGVAGATGTGSTTSTTAAGTIVPLYTDPSDPSWTAIVEAKMAHPKVPVIAIVNPNNGPGGSVSSGYSAGIAKLVAANIEVLGYVATGYASHPVATMEATIDQWKSFYPQVQGIFFDEQSNQAGDVTYYKTLSQYAKSKGLSYTVGNPGTDTAEAFIGALDTMLIYESSGVPSVAQMSGWHSKYPKSNFGVIPYAVPAMNASFVATARQYVGYIYLQSDNLPNPWDSLPAYFADLLAALE